MSGTDAPITSFLEFRRNKTVDGYDANIKCVSKANPPLAAFTWFHDSSLLTEDLASYAFENSKDKDNITTTGSLTINNVRESDYGTYKCQAKTDLGSSYHEINVTLSCG